jgi:asparagine synthase (glutamine-hydrolysing)
LLNRKLVGGIIGKVGFDSHETLATAVLEQMLDTSAGSRDAARRLHTAPGIAIGACSAPVGDAHDSVTAQNSVTTGTAGLLAACADARLTNGHALRTQLLDLGHRFQGSSDDELILRAYEQWGIAAFARLRGPFACAIWNAADRRLVLARDQMGIQPLYFALLPDHGVVFASHTRALLCDPGVQRDWCPAAIDAYLTLGYVPAPLSPYQRISKLEAGHALIVEGRRLHVEAYWDLPLAARTTASEHELIADLAAHLRRSTAGIAAERSGLLYSGGIASTALLSTASATGPVVTSAFDHDASDIVRSGRAASLLGYPRELETTTPDAVLLARQFAAACDEPVADPAAITQLAACLAMRRHAGAAIGAHGAATLWADHARHRMERVESMARAWLAWPLTALTGGIGRSLPEGTKGAHALSHLGMPAADACAVKHAYGLWDDDHRRTLYTREFAWQVRDSNPFARHLELYDSRDTNDRLDRALYVDARTFLPDSLLAMSAGAARAADLDLHLPMLDVDVVSAAAVMPTRLKRHGAAGMHALRTLLSRELPSRLMPPAQRTPARHAWLTGALAALVPQVLLGARFDERGIVSRPALQRLWQEHAGRRRDHAHRLWSLVSLEFWFRHVIDGHADESPLEYAILTPRRGGAPTTGAPKAA